VSADAPGEKLATLYVSHDEVWWDPEPSLSTKSAVLTVSAPNGEVTTETFPPGEQPFYSVEEDGTYAYELYGLSSGRGNAQAAMPAGSPGAIDANGRPEPASSNAANPVQARRGTVQSGYFTVAGAVPVDPNEVEE
jgi:hypothetical protein